MSLFRCSIEYLAQQVSSFRGRLICKYRPRCALNHERNHVLSPVVAVDILEKVKREINLKRTQCEQYIDMGILCLT